MKNQRIYRIADQIQMQLACLIQHELKDPRIGMVTITSVDVSPDLKHAKVYFNVHNEAKEKEKTLEIFRGAVGFLRSCLARELNLRVTPMLHFNYDDTLTKAQYIDDLLDHLK